MSYKKLAVGLGAIMLVLLMSGVTYAQPSGYIPTRAGTTFVNGVFDGAEADAASELSITLSGVVNGIPLDSLSASDTITVDTGYAFSSLDSLDIADATGTSYDTIYVEYWIQNYGNGASDSFYILATILDTSDVGHFVPRDFDICRKSDSTEVGGVLSADSAWYGTNIAQGATDTFLVRVVVPGPDSAADQDSIHIELSVSDKWGTGTDDTWPDWSATAQSRVVLDTSGIWYSHTHNDTIWDYGDTQLDTMRLVIGGANLRILKTTALMSGTSYLPGDTLVISSITCPWG
jgi:hypothetical protein